MKNLYRVGGAICVSTVLLLGQGDLRPELPSAAVVEAADAHVATKAMRLANRQRVVAGLPKLRRAKALNSAALQHSIDQAHRGSMSHTGSDGSDAGQRISRNGGKWRTWAENVASGYPTARSVVNGWMNSSGHRRNLLNPSMKRMSVAVAYSSNGTPYWTMVLKG